jgi:hypothetical protein
MVREKNRLYVEGEEMASKYDYVVSIDGVDATALINKMGGPAEAKKFLAEGLSLVKPRPLNFIVEVMRSLRPGYPTWVEKLQNPELELVGPDKYDLRDLCRWACSGHQKGKDVAGHLIYQELCREGLLPRCLGLQDFLAIQLKGWEVYTEVFQEEGTTLHAWRSVAWHPNGNLYVPTLGFAPAEEDGEEDVMVIGWDYLDSEISSDEPPILFK